MAGPLALLLASLAWAPVLKDAQAAFEEGLRQRGSPQEARKWFQRAANAYETARRAGLNHADLFRSQGNACYLAGDLPRAVFAYRRGLRFEPADPELHAGLELARQRLRHLTPADFPNPPAIRKPWFAFLGPLSIRFWIAYSAYIFFWGSLLGWLQKRGRGLLLWLFASWIIVTVLAADVGLCFWQEYCLSRHPLIVLAQEEVLRTGNGVSYPPRLTRSLPAGVEAELRFCRGAWLQIELADGTVGWIPAAAALVDKPNVVGSSLGPQGAP